MVKQCGTAWWNSVARCGTVCNGMVEQCNSVVERCGTVWWNSVEQHGGRVWHSLMEQCGMVWWNSDT